MRRQWQDAPCVFVPAPRIPRPLCPSCGSTANIPIRSMPRETDGSQTRLAVCGDCSEPFKIITDPELDWDDAEFSIGWKVAIPGGVKSGHHLNNGD